MMAIKKILFPTDLSPFAEHVLLYATAMARKFDAALYMLYVEEVLPRHIRGVDLCVSGDQVRSFHCGAAIEEEAHVEMQSLLDKADMSDLEVKQFVARGMPGIETTEFAKNQEIDLIVMATHGRTRLKHVIPGYTTEQIVHKAPCPVLSIKHPEHEFIMR